jgi:hypothetical protein
MKCGGTGRLVSGEPCPDCASEQIKTVPIVQGVPAQYQGVSFDKSFLPEKEQKEYGTFMEELLQTIINDLAFYQKNMIICSRPNSGKTVWAYNLYSLITSKGYEMPPLKDVAEVRTILYSYDDKELAQLYSTARCVVIKIPRDIQPWMFDSIAAIVERRVRSDGFTIFLFGGNEMDLKAADKYGKLGDLRGTGAYNTLQIKSFDRR